MPLGVVAVQWLLDPDQVEGLQAPAHAPRHRPVPLLVGIDHQRESLAQVLAHRADAVQVQRPVGLADLELDAADALVPGNLGVLQQLLERRMQKAAGGVVAAHRVALGTEQTRQRQPGPARLEIPQRHVEGTDGLGRQPAAPHRCAGPAQLVP